MARSSLPRAALTGLFLATAAVAGGALMVAPPAFAGHGEGNGGGGGNGGGNGNGGGHGASANAGGHGVADHGASGHEMASAGDIAAATGALNAAHANPSALAHAAPGSRPGQLATYDHAMLSALSMPAATPSQIFARNAAIAAARMQLAATANKALTAPVVAHVDELLGLPATNPYLGATPSG